MAAVRAPASDRQAGALDDERDRDELRRRYYGLLSELRILLPGTQVLVAFLLTAPFQQRFVELDTASQRLFGASLVAGLLAIVAFSAPTAFHRFGLRTDRAERLAWCVRLTRAGLVFFAVSLVGAAAVVTQFVFGRSLGVVLASLVVAALVAVWIALPVFTRLHRPGER